ncbi:GH11933 [Drosophila grimshawi]|uniref:GH11933 n=1 Tax=Drosophila grimshawi TaxID=7222 RepID=B4JL46_DROGR|nr:GH11933 [Drosophila grimshawi]
MPRLPGPELLRNRTVGIFLILWLSYSVSAKQQSNPGRQFGSPSFGNGLGISSNPGLGLGYPSSGAGQVCPLCDSSVYTYCSHKMVHDACCCDFPVHQPRPSQCVYFDCSLLYAKSCYEHALIKNCCCNNPY